MKYFGKFTFSNILPAAIMLISIAQTFAGTCPCDIYAAGGTPCVAAHSTVRALYSSYNGPLYQVKRTSDGKTLDIGVMTPGGVADAASQDAFLNGKPGTISKIYDQSPKGNHLTKAPGGGFPTACLEANATAAKISVNGHTAYGVYTTGAFEPKAGVGYRNNQATGLATGDQPEGIYMVCSGKHYNQWCCFDYGNGETNTKDNGPGTMETVYFGSSTQWGRGSGTGPWVMADLEDGVYAGGSFAAPPTNTSIIADFVTAIVKGKSGNYFAIRGGNAQTGTLKDLYAGARPTKVATGSYVPMRKEGAIVLGVGGDNSHTAEGTFFEGAITTGYPSDATENAVQENIIAAGYGRTTTSTSYGVREVTTMSMFKASYNPLNSNAVISYSLQNAQHVSIKIIDQQGRQIASIVNDVSSAGRHEAVWDTKRVPSGVYVCSVVIDGTEGWAGKIAVGK